MHGGELFAEIVMVAGLTVGAGWLIWMMATAQDMRREDERAHGDVVELPAAARIDAGEAALRRSDGLAQGLDRTHSEGRSK
jgi:type VI protein secretion system component VasK